MIRPGGVLVLKQAVVIDDGEDAAGAFGGDGMAFAAAAEHAEMHVVELDSRNQGWTRDEHGKGVRSRGRCVDLLNLGVDFLAEQTDFAEVDLGGLSLERAA